MGFAQKIADRLYGTTKTPEGDTISKVDIENMIMIPDKFRSGEFNPFFKTEEDRNLSGKHVYLIMVQGPYNDPNSMVFRAVTAATAAKENGAERVIVVATDHPFDRAERGPIEDKKMRGKGATAKAVARTFHANSIDQILTMHMHTPVIEKIYQDAYGINDGRKVLLNISPHFILAHYLRTRSPLTELINEMEGENLVIIAADKGSEIFVDKVYFALGFPKISRVYFDKARKIANNTDAVDIKINRVSDNFTSLQGKIVLFADDKIDSGGTYIQTTRWVTGEQKEVPHNMGTPSALIAYATHAVFGGMGFQTVAKNLANTITREFIVSNTRPYVCDRTHHKFKTKSTILRMAGIFADAILNCCETGIHPDDHYKFASFSDMDAKIGDKYSIERSSTHFMMGGSEHNEE